MVTESEEEEVEAFFSVMGAFLAVLGAATAAGLTMGLMSLDSLDLLVLTESDPDDCKDEEERQELQEEKKYAAQLLPLIEDHHRLLVTLLLLNSVCVEALPIFLDSLVPSSVAVLLGVFFLLVFGEILPSAVFTGPSGMRTSARLAPLVRFFLFVMAPIAIPIGRFLDWWVGDDEDTAYNRSELLALLRIHAGKAAGKLITVRQSRMMQGAMDLMHVTAGEAMTPLEHMYMLSTDSILNLETMAEIVGKGYSRIPVYEKDNRNHVIGVLLTKTLAVVNPDDNVRVGNLFARPCGCIAPDQPLYDAMAVMKATRSHLCFVTDDPIRLNKIMRKVGKHPEASGRMARSFSTELPKILGCISLHDITSHIVATDIADEYSSRRPRRERTNSVRSVSSTEDERSPMLSSSLQQVSAPSVDETSLEDAKVEFKSEFARERVMRWMERARLSARLHREMQEAAASSATTTYSTSVVVTKAEVTPLVGPPSGRRPSVLAGPERSTAVARKLLSSWLVKRTTSQGTVRVAEVQRTLEQVTISTVPPKSKSQVSPGATAKTTTTNPKDELV